MKGDTSSKRRFKLKTGGYYRDTGKGAPYHAHYLENYCHLVGNTKKLKGAILSQRMHYFVIDMHVR